MTEKSYILEKKKIIEERVVGIKRQEYRELVIFLCQTGNIKELKKVFKDQNILPYINLEQESGQVFSSACSGASEQVLEFLLYSEEVKKHAHLNFHKVALHLYEKIFTPVPVLNSLLIKSGVLDDLKVESKTKIFQLLCQGDLNDLKLFKSLRCNQEVLGIVREKSDNFYIDILSKTISPQVLQYLIIELKILPSPTSYMLPSEHLNITRLLGLCPESHAAFIEIYKIATSHQKLQESIAHCSAKKRSTNSSKI